MTHLPTEEQSAAIDHCAQSAHANLMLNAYAGTGKSATLKLIDVASRIHPALYLVFNKRNADEAKASGEFRSTTVVKTFNALGHGIWAGHISGSISLDKSKSRTLWRQMTDDMTKGEASAAWPDYMVVMDGIEKAKALGYVPKACKLPHTSLISRSDLHRAMDERPSNNAADLIDELILESITAAFHGLIDFNDQIYMPALFGGTFPKFPRIMVDEYQDQSPVNHAMLARCVKGRLIGVGDPFQNIYGFRGAAAGGMGRAIESYNMSELPLSVSFRCPQAIVEAARWRVPEFKWIKPGGKVTTEDQFDGSSFPDDATVICRNNAPLLRLAFKLISAGRSVSVLGSELGPKLVGILRKLGDSILPRPKAMSAIEEWREQRLIAGSKSANDLADCMRVLCEHGDTLGAAISYAEHIFAQQGTIRLLTGHKSKGLEFADVFWLDPWLCGDSEQDLNLRYVITTRSQNSLTLIDSNAIQW
jgi:UvrD/REP helicase N-terminal domain/UvrD-like helicase C-terminal domain